MGRRLKGTVVSKGVIYAAGTPETPDLVKTVSNPDAWEGEADKPAAPEKPAPKK